MMSPKRRNIISLLFARLVLILFLIFVHLNAQKSKENKFSINVKIKPTDTVSNKTRR